MQPSPDELDRIQHASELDMAILSIERDSTRLAKCVPLFGASKGIRLGVASNAKRLVAIPWASSCLPRVSGPRAEDALNEMDTSLVMAACIALRLYSRGAVEHPESV